MNLNHFLPTPLFTLGASLAALEAEVEAEKEKRKQNRYRVPGEREDLDVLLIAWVTQVISSDDHKINYGYTYVDDILPFSTRKALVWARPQSFLSVAALKMAVNESDNWYDLWSSQIIDIVRQYDNKLYRKEHQR